MGKLRLLEKEENVIKLNTHNGKYYSEKKNNSILSFNASQLAHLKEQ